MLKKKEYIANLKKIKMGNHIPKTIYQTYISKENLPLEIQKNIKKLKKLNEDWEYHLYDDNDIDNFIFQNYGIEILNIYKTINPSYGAARADFFRYLLIYARGGVYLDIKSSLTQPLNNLITSNDRYILSTWDTPGIGNHKELISCKNSREYQQWHIISVKGHPFLREVIKQIINNIHQYNIFEYGVGKHGVIKLTGPIVYTLVIDSMETSYPFREVNIEKEYGFIYSIYNNNLHYDLFNKHYSVLKTPIVPHNTFQDTLLMILYNIKMIPSYMKMTIWIYFSKKHPNLLSQYHKIKKNFKQ